jgi:hypothetical protein
MGALDLFVLRPVTKNKLQMQWLVLEYGIGVNRYSGIKA